MLTGDATGLAKTVEAAMATVIRIGQGETSSTPAAATAMTATSTVVAVFEINRLKTGVRINCPAIRARGSKSPRLVVRPYERCPLQARDCYRLLKSP